MGATCPGCAAYGCACSARATGTARRSESGSQARRWDWIKTRYLQDGFCDACAAQAAYGHQLGFSQVAPVCDRCRGKVPTYREAGERAHHWAGSVLRSAAERPGQSETPGSPVLSTAQAATPLSEVRAATADGAA